MPRAKVKSLRSMIVIFDRTTMEESRERVRLEVEYGVFVII